MPPPLARGAAVLKYVQDPSVRSNADLVRFLCVFNMYNWQYVPEDLRGDEALYRAMLASPWNAPEAVQAKIPPLVLQLGGEDDCKNKDRVLAAVKHSSFNIIYVHEDLHGNPEVVAWAGAPREVTAITAEEAAHFDAEYQAILHKKPPEDGRGGNEHDFNMLLAAESFMQGHMNDAEYQAILHAKPPDHGSDGRGGMRMAWTWTAEEWQRTVSVLAESYMQRHRRENRDKRGAFFQIPPSVRRILWPELARDEK
jgi:hypothetical protein